MDPKGRIFIREDGTLDWQPPPASPRPNLAPSLSLPRAVKEMSASPVASAPNSNHSTSILGHNDNAIPTMPSRSESPSSDTLTTPAMQFEAAKFPITGRTFWERRVRMPQEGGLTIGNILNQLGLKRSAGTRGASTFDNDDVSQLADAIARVANKLPKTRARLVDTAVSPYLLSTNIDELMKSFGEKIWAADEEKAWLMKPGEAEGYTRELLYDHEKERALIKEYLRLWFIVKGINAATYQKYKKKDSRAVKDATSKAEISEIVDEESETDLDLNRDLAIYTSDVGEVSIDEWAVSANGKVPHNATASDEDSSNLRTPHSRNEQPLAFVESKQDLSLTMAFHLNNEKVQKIVMTKRKQGFFQQKLLKSTALTSLAHETLLKMFKPCGQIETTYVPDRLDNAYEQAVPPTATTVATDRDEDAVETAQSFAATRDLKTKHDLDVAFALSVAQTLTNARPTRTIRKHVPTYNVAILTGRTIHTPTKYLEKHHTNVLHYPKSSERSAQLHDWSEDLASNIATEAPREQDTTRMVNVVSNRADAPRQSRVADKRTRDIVIEGDKTAMYPDAARLTGPATRKRKTSTLVADLPDQILVRKSKVSRITGQAMTAAFVKYLKADTPDPSLETALLNDIEGQLTIRTPHLARLLDGPQHFTTFPGVMKAWLIYRRSILSVRVRALAPRNPKLTEIQYKVLCSRLRTELRVAHDTFIAGRSDNDEIICGAFQALQDGDEGVGFTMREDLRRLDEKLLELGDLVGGGKWIMMG